MSSPPRRCASQDAIEVCRIHFDFFQTLPAPSRAAAVVTVRGLAAVVSFGDILCEHYRSVHGSIPVIKDEELAQKGFAWFMGKRRSGSRDDLKADASAYKGQNQRWPDGR